MQHIVVEPPSNLKGINLNSNWTSPKASVYLKNQIMWQTMFVIWSMYSVAIAAHISAIYAYLKGNQLGIFQFQERIIDQAIILRMSATSCFFLSNAFTQILSLPGNFVENIYIRLHRLYCSLNDTSRSHHEESISYYIKKKNEESFCYHSLSSA